MADEKPRRSVFFSGVEPVPASEVKASLDDYTTEERRDGPSDTAGSSSGGSHNVHGEPLDLSHIELIEAHACLGLLWEYAEALEKDTEKSRGPGRPREHKVFEAVLFEVTAGLRGNGRDIARTFSDPKTWQRLQDTVAQAWPRHPHRRLSNKPISRSQHHRFRERYLHGEILEELDLIVERIEVDATLHMGLLSAETGSVNHPDTTQFIVGDGTWIPSIYKTGSRQIINPKTGKVRRFDPDAVPYHTPTGTVARGAYGQQLVLASVRGPYRNERIILRTAFKPPGKSDATVFCDMVLGLLNRHPQLRKGLRGGRLRHGPARHRHRPVPSGMSAKQSGRRRPAGSPCENRLPVVLRHPAHLADRTLDTGAIPISKVQRTKGDKPAAVNLGQHTFTTPKAKQAVAEVIALDGIPTRPLSKQRRPNPHKPGCHPPPPHQNQHPTPARRPTTLQKQPPTTNTTNNAPKNAPTPPL